MRYLLLAVALMALGASPTLVDQVHQAVVENNLPLAEAYVQRYRAQNGVNPEMIEALSWLGRGALAARQFDKAESYAKQTDELAAMELKKRPLDAEPHL